MQIPILSGIYTDESSNIRVSYPRNLIPIIQENGISQGYLRPADGIVVFGQGPGIDRGGINWNNECYRVMGTKLIKVLSDGSHTVIGDVGGAGQVTLYYGFTYLGVVSSGNLFLYDGTTLTQVTDPDLGTVIDLVWVDGYFMTTDGTYLIVTELTDPFSVNPLKYGSSESDPDTIKGLLKIRNEVYALNRHTIEVFNNIGGNGFPFERVEGAQIEKGTVGTHANCVFLETVAFVGSGFNESVSIYLGYNGVAVKIATREIDLILSEYSTNQLSAVVCESRVDSGYEHLLVRLPDQTLVYDSKASKATGNPVWFTLTSSIVDKSAYRATNLVRCYDKWIVGDPVSSNLGYLVDNVSTYYGNENGWEFGTTILYNEGRGLIFHELELVSLTGRVAQGVESTVWTQYSLDGETWSQQKAISAGKIGQRDKRLTWFRQGKMRNYRMQRFRGTSESHLTIARLEARVEPLYE